MKLWILRPKLDLPSDNPWEPWHDKAFGFVIQAPNEETARQLANENGGDETGDVKYVIYRTGGHPWLDSKQSDCVELVSEGNESKVIMRDFAAA